MSDKIRDIVEEKHSIYKCYARYWDFLLSSYEGGVDYTNAEIPFSLQTRPGSDVIPVYANGQLLTSKQLSNNLFMHAKERQEHFNQRIRMSYYYNFCQPVIDIYTEHLFKQPVKEEWGGIEQLIEYRQEDIDLKGSSIFEFRKELSDCSQIYGHCFVLVDKPPSNGEVNLEQRIVNNQFPYATIIAPQRVINWSVDRFGRLYWVMICENGDTNTSPDSYDKSSKAKSLYRLWTRNEWYLYDGEYNLIEEGVHGLGVVPLICVYDRPSKKYQNFLGISSLSDIAFVARDIFNLCSELTQIIRDQTFSFLTLQGDITDYEGLSAIGTNKGLVYPRDTNPPQYVSPSADNARVIMDQIDRQTKKIYQLAKLEGGESASQKTQVESQSGVSKAFDFQETNSSLSRKANNLNDGELKMWKVFSLWEGKEFDGVIEYPDEFSVQAVNDDIAEAIEMNKLKIGNLARIEVNKAIIQKKFPRMDDIEIEKIIKDMEAEVNKPEPGVNGFGGSFLDRFKQRQTANAGSG